MQFCCDQRHTGYVPTRVTEAWHQAASKRIASHDDYRNLTRRLLRCECTGRVERHDDIDLESNQFSGKFRKEVELFLGRPELEEKIASFDVTEFA